MTDLEITCRMCHKDLKKLGGLMFSPPTEQVDRSISQVVKSHLCDTCYKKITEFISNNGNYPEPDKTTCKFKQQIEQIIAYVRLLQDGDPENEDAKEILDFIDKVTERKM